MSFSRFCTWFLMIANIIGAIDSFLYHNWSLMMSDMVIVILCKEILSLEAKIAKSNED